MQPKIKINGLTTECVKLYRDLIAIHGKAMKLAARANEEVDRYDYINKPFDQYLDDAFKPAFEAVCAVMCDVATAFLVDSEGKEI